MRMDRNSLTYQTFKNISYNIVGYVWPMIFTLFVTPIIIFGLGIKTYGIYLFINTFIAFFGLLDLGLGTAVSKYMAYYYGKKDYVAIATLTHTANSLFLFLGLIGLTISAIIAFWGSTVLPAQFSAYSEYFPIIFIAGSIFFLTTIINPYSSILNAVQRFDISNMIGISTFTISNLSILTIVLLHGSLQSIFIVQLIINFLSASITVYKAIDILPQATIRYGWDKQEFMKCYKFGIVTLINNIANNALSYLDRMIIPLYVGPSNLTYYSLPGNITGKIPGFSGILSATIFPTTSQFEGGNEPARIENLYIRSFRLITIITAALTVAAISFAYKTLLYWLGPDFATQSANILIILAITNFILSFFGPLSSFLLGLGKLKFLTTMSVSMGILNALLLFILLPPFGITGAALAYLLSVLPIGYILYYTEKKYLRLAHRKKYYLKTTTGIILVSVIVWTIDTFILSLLVINMATLLIIGGTSIILYIILYKILGFFETEDWKDLEYFKNEISKKIHSIFI